MPQRTPTSAARGRDGSTQTHRGDGWTGRHLDQASGKGAPDDSGAPARSSWFTGGEDLSDDRRSSLADLIERIQGGVVEIATGGGSGSGFIISADRMVVTNEHVVGGARSVEIWLTNGRLYYGEVLERSADADFALVQGLAFPLSHPRKTCL